MPVYRRCPPAAAAVRESSLAAPPARAGARPGLPGWRLAPAAAAAWRLAGRLAAAAGWCAALLSVGVVAADRVSPYVVVVVVRAAAPSRSPPPLAAALATCTDQQEGTTARRRHPLGAVTTHPAPAPATHARMDGRRHAAARTTACLLPWPMPLRACAHPSRPPPPAKAGSPGSGASMIPAACLRPFSREKQQILLCPRQRRCRLHQREASTPTGGPTPAPGSAPGACTGAGRRRRLPRLSAAGAAAHTLPGQSDPRAEPCTPPEEGSGCARGRRWAGSGRGPPPGRRGRRCRCTCTGKGLGRAPTISATHTPSSPRPADDGVTCSRKTSR